jgi:hypothetical protein
MFTATARFLFAIANFTPNVASLPRHQTNCSKRFSTAVFTKQLSTSTTLIYSTPDPPPRSNYKPSVVVRAISAQVCVGQVEKAAKGFLSSFVGLNCLTVFVLRMLPLEWYGSLSNVLQSHNISITKWFVLLLLVGLLPMLLSMMMVLTRRQW